MFVFFIIDQSMALSIIMLSTQFIQNCNLIPEDSVNPETSFYVK